MAVLSTRDSASLVISHFPKFSNRQNGCPLFSKNFPQEIRDEIYVYVFCLSPTDVKNDRLDNYVQPEGDMSKADFKWARVNNTMPARYPLLLTCHRLYDEGIDHYINATTTVVIARGGVLKRTHYFDADPVLDISPVAAERVVTDRGRDRYDPASPKLLLPTDHEQTFAKIARGLARRLGNSSIPILPKLTLIIEMDSQDCTPQLVVLLRSVAAGKGLQVKNLQVHIILSAMSNPIPLSFFDMLQRTFHLMPGVKTCTVEIRPNALYDFGETDKLVVAQIKAGLERYALLPPPVVSQTEFSRRRVAFKASRQLLRERDALEESFQFTTMPEIDVEARKWVTFVFKHLFHHAMPSLEDASKRLDEQRKDEYALKRQDLLAMEKEFALEGVDVLTITNSETAWCGVSCQH